MRVEMRVELSGTRNGAEWPPVGGVVDLPDGEAVDLLNAGLAGAVRDPDPETATVPPKVSRRRRP